MVVPSDLIGPAGGAESARRGPAHQPSGRLTMYRSLLLVLCLSAPCAAETVTLDFSVDPLPEWIDVLSGVFREEWGGINSGEQGEIGDGSAWIQFHLDRPFTLDSITFTGGQDYLYPYAFLGECKTNLPVEDYDWTGPITREYGCTSYNGRGEFKLESFDGESEWVIVTITGMTLTIVDPVPLVMGDTDYDADVDLQDLNYTRNSFGGDPVYAYGDANKDGSINLSDLNDVRNNFGSSASQAVPEPSSWILAALLISPCFHILRTRMQPSR